MAETNTADVAGLLPTGKIGLHNLSPAPASHRARKRLGRGPGSGTGKTAGKGHKGSMARAGHGGPGGGSVTVVSEFAFGGFFVCCRGWLANLT